MASRRHFGTVRKRPSGRWQAIYWFEGGLHSGGTFNTKADALTRLSTLEADFRRGAWIDPAAGQITVRAFATEWLARRAGLSVRTRELYEDLLRQRTSLIGAINLGGIVPVHGSRLQRRTRRQTSQYRLQGVSPPLHNHAHRRGRRSHYQDPVQGQRSRHRARGRATDGDHCRGGSPHLRAACSPPAHRATRDVVSTTTRRDPWSTPTGHRPPARDSSNRAESDLHARREFAHQITKDGGGSTDLVHPRECIEHPQQTLERFHKTRQGCPPLHDGFW